MTISKRWVTLAVIALLAVQAAQVVCIVHRESITWDEDDHMFAGYMMWKTGDYGLNPEHPPLVKLLATLPLLGEKLWIPRLQNREFKAEAYLDGRDWLARNDGASQRLVFRMRLAAGLLALGLSLVIFFAAREWFGTPAALVALTLAVFDPNLLAHSALVTTDIGVSLFILASIYAFYRYVKRPTLLRLLLTGVVAGLLLATKHSGILLAPMLLMLIAGEIVVAPRGSRGRVALSLSGAFAAIVVISVTILWAFYGFRYAARPAGLALSTSLADYAGGLSHFNAAAVLWIAHLHLLPESYLMGLVDVKLVAQWSPTFALGKNYEHGQWWYFPAVILIKTTLGLLLLLMLTAFAIVSRRLRKGREVVYLLLPAAVYLAVSMLSGLNIGARHILPLYAIAAILAAAGITALAERRRRWAYIGAALIIAHIASALTVFPNDMAYANEAWGGPRNVYKLLSDSNEDWGQQLYQVKEWQDRHPGEECWFAYFASPVIDPAVYGIRCHVLPNEDTGWLGGADLIPPVISGNIVLSAGDLMGSEISSSHLNPYTVFQQIPPDEMIDDSVLVYHGTFRVNPIAAYGRVQRAYELMNARKPEEALAMVREAAALNPQGVKAQRALGDIAARLGHKDEARAACMAALAAAKELEPEAGAGIIADLEAKLKKL
ncbi:MAG: glycosyltransferase family 39 protein [Terracidiphilus sp.]|jgi:tetratricopeptide (TPR) repeat protein